MGLPYAFYVNFTLGKLCFKAIKKMLVAFKFEL